MSYAARLKKMNEDYRAQKAHTGGGVHPPAGKYHMRIEKALLEEAKKSKELQVMWQLVIVGGEHSGRKLFKRTTIEGQYGKENMGYLKGDLKTLGHPMKNIQSLVGKNGVLQKCVGIIIDGAVGDSKNPKFYNVWFNGLVEEMPTSNDLETAPADDIQFENAPEDDGEIDLGEDGEDPEPGAAEPEPSTGSQETEPEEGAADETNPDNWAMDDVETVEQ